MLIPHVLCFQLRVLAEAKSNDRQSSADFVFLFQPDNINTKTRQTKDDFFEGRVVQLSFNNTQLNYYFT